MHIGKTVQKCLDGHIIQRVIALINLENLSVSFYIISADRERNHHLDAVGLAEVGKRSHLLGIKWTKDDVALVSAFLQECIPDISINRNVPGMHIYIGALLLQGFASQQRTAVILHHSLAVAIYIVQRQHHAYLYRISGNSSL